MSEVRLVVREAERDWSGTVHGSCADRVIAALSADPVTLDELEAAIARFEKPRPNCRVLANLRAGLEDEPHDAGVVVIDLIARLVMTDSTWSSPDKDGYIEYHDGQCCTDEEVRYHLADDWLFLRDPNQWRHFAEARRRERAERPPFDARVVLYGRPLVEFIAREIVGAFARRDEIAAVVHEHRLVSPFCDTISQIHAAWLLTPRDDLNAASPRTAALERRNHITWDLQDRSQQWTFLGECPPGLARSSHAFQYGGLGIHELVMYYELVRELLWSSWERLTEMAQSPSAEEKPDAISVGDFLQSEVPRLEKVREAWLDAPHDEFDGRTPRSIIHRERARLPEGVGGGHDGMIDPDCPCCQMMAELPGQSFWHLDGSEMDDDFAFDMWCLTREEWDAEQRRMEESFRRFDTEEAERKRLGVNSSAPGEDGSNAVWSRSYCVGDTADMPLGIRVFALGCHLAELIVGLRAGNDTDSAPPECRYHIDQLNRDFGNLRELLHGADVSLSAALFDPVIDRFSETLAAISTARPELAPKCESLISDLGKLLAPPSHRPDRDIPDSDIFDDVTPL